MKKVVIIHNIISPHVSPLFIQIARKVNLTVLYCAQKEENRNWQDQPTGFDFKVLKNISIRFKNKDLLTYFFNLSIIKELKTLKPEVVVISGWDQPSYYAAYLYCKFTKTKFILWSGSTEYEKNFARLITRGLVKVLIKGADRCIAYGSRARKYLISLGANSKKIYVSYNTTDIQKYRSLSEKYKSSIGEIKQSLRLSNMKIILYYGQLIERKGIKTLIESYKEANKTLPNIALLIIGNGKEKNELVKIAQDIKGVTICPDPGDDKICKFFAIADVFVLPSKEEVWGLAVNEAMAAGLPVIVSDKAGSSVDLVKNGSEGYTFQSGNKIDLAKKITWILSDDNLRRRMSKNSLKTIQKFTPEISAREFLKAIL